MPLCDLYLISLHSNISHQLFLQTLRQNSIVPIIQARVLRWIILPTKLSTASLLAKNNHWNLLVLLPNGTKLPPESHSQIAGLWSVTAGVPSRLLQDFSRKNAELINRSAESIPTAEKPTSKNLKSSTQSLELSAELQAWIDGLPAQVSSHPISMLNLLAFNPGKKEQYQKYGAAFAESVGSRHGGNAKIVGNVVAGEGKEDGWDEIALAHYPTLRHFAAMLSSPDYQDANRKYRLGSLMDTFILCTMEINDKGDLAKL